MFANGFKRVARDFYQVHDRPKQLFVRELVKHAARTLRERQLPEALAGYERKVQPRCLLPQDQVQDLWQVLHQQVPESRNVHGLRHKQATVLAIVFAYLLSGGRGGPARRGPVCPGFVPDPTGGFSVLVQPRGAPLRSSDRELHLSGAQSGPRAGLSTGHPGLAKGAPGPS